MVLNVGPRGKVYAPWLTKIVSFSAAGRDGNLPVTDGLTITLHDTRGDNVRTALGEISFKVEGDVTIKLTVLSPDSRNPQIFKVALFEIFKVVDGRRPVQKDLISAGKVQNILYCACLSFFGAKPRKNMAHVQTNCCCASSSEQLTKRSTQTKFLPRM